MDNKERQKRGVEGEKTWGEGRGRQRAGKERER